MIDLHMHSRYSNDGEFAPSALVETCAERGIDTMSVTDHNCVRACAEAMSAAVKCGIVCLPGTEIDCTYSGVHFHLLGYGIDCASPDFDKIENAVRAQGAAASLQMLEKTRAMGFRIDEAQMQELARDSYWPETWTGELFAEVLLSRPDDADHPLLMPYRAGGERGDNPQANFYWDFYAQGKPCYAEMRYPAMEEVIDLIHRNGGAAVLAHPLVNINGNRDLLDGVIGLGIDGIEAYSSYHSPAQTAGLAMEAKRRGLFFTCGSDYHGRTKPSVFPGEHGGAAEDVMRAQLEKLFRKITK